LIILYRFSIISAIFKQHLFHDVVLYKYTIFTAVCGFRIAPGKDADQLILEWSIDVKQVSANVFKGFSKWILNLFGGTFKNAFNSVNNIRQAPMENSITLAIMVARIGALVMFIVAFISFIVNNGYGEQLGIIAQGIGQWSRTFTMGTLPFYISGAVPVIWTILLVLVFFTIHIAYILSEDSVKKVLMIFLMLMFFTAVLLYLLFVRGVIYDLHMPVNSFESLWRNIEINQIPWFIPAIYLIVVGLILALASLMAIKSGLGKQMKEWLSTVLSLYIGLPLLLWFTQNLLALAVMIVFLGIVGGIMYILFNILYTKLGEGGDRAADARAGDLAADKGRTGVMPSGHPPGEGTAMTVIEVEPGKKLWKIRSVTGDYIQSESSGGETSEVCTTADFDKGKVIIMQNGEQVGMIPWKQASTLKKR